MRFCKFCWTESEALLEIDLFSRSTRLRLRPFSFFVMMFHRVALVCTRFLTALGSREMNQLPSTAN